MDRYRLFIIKAVNVFATFTGFAEFAHLSHCQEFVYLATNLTHSICYVTET